ncbi:MAG: hypothetical protein UX99_C0021G0009 [Candidatus Amesbacteria bacterium GW2011_GWB1_47_26]|nr:MAG: hypothetical protein UX99_C0021G0009 [Candidatus Amesbacteria bacterium GW2011_GWB1_47_26]
MMKWWMLIVMMWVVTAMPVKVNAQGALAGDANGDCKVDGVDFVVVFNNYGKPTSGGATQGDPRADTDTDTNSNPRRSDSDIATDCHRTGDMDFGSGVSWITYERSCLEHSGIKCQPEYYTQPYESGR